LKKEVTWYDEHDKMKYDDDEKDEYDKYGSSAHGYKDDYDKKY
jgi:hypothetical protein